MKGSKRALACGLALLIFVLLAACGGQRTETSRLEDQGEWVYLRGGQPVQPGETLVELVAAGDTNLARSVNPQTAFDSSAAWLRAADIALLNLECALSERPGLEGAEGAAGSPYRLVASPEAAEALAQAGIDIAGLANNHTLDADPDGLADTVQTLEQAGVTALGAGADPSAAAALLVKSVRGLKIAFLAYNAVTSPDPALPGWSVAAWQRDQAEAAVRRAAMQSDAVVVSLHWGSEYQLEADFTQVEDAQALIAAGADLVIGHHPHVTQPVMVQARAEGSAGLAAFSLGNFVFDQGSNTPAGEKVNQGLVLRAFFDRDGLRAVQALPVRAGLKPALDGSSDAALPRVETSAPDWEQIHFTCTSEGCQETPGSGTAPQSGPESGLFRAGQIDLDGDLEPEEVRLENYRILVYKHGVLDWQSPPEYRVLDLALGDPDADGRGDLVLAMEKPDKQGVIQSHPFVMSKRGGVYRTVWGGSPVSDPLKEVELADIDGDGQVELLVLEEERGGAGRAVTVWHWHGWGFSLDWRSEYGQYEQMVALGQEIWVRRLDR